MSQTFAQLINGKSATVEFSTGSASTPSVAFSGDTNTGIYSPGADQVAISTGGSGRLFVDSTGRVGVNTSSPVELLHVSGTSNPSIQLTATNDTTPKINWATNGTDRLEITSSSVVGASINVRSNQELRLGTNNTERLRITSAGLVGVGTSSPTGQLDVRGSATDFDGLRVLNTNTSSGTQTSAAIRLGITNSFGAVNGIRNCRIQATEDTTDSNNVHLDFYTNSAVALDSETVKMRLTSGGNLGIGTTSPTATLEVKGGQIVLNTTTANSSAVIYRINDVTKGYIGPAGILGGSDNDMGYRVESGNNQVFYIGATERARIDSSGRFGIGTTSPLTIFDVKPSSNRHIVFSASASYASNAVVGVDDAGGESALGIGGNPIQFFTGTTERARIDSSGRLLVGTSSSSAGTRAVFQGQSAGAGSGAQIHLQRDQAAASIGSGQPLGIINFADNAANVFATVSAEVDATAGTNDYPGRLVFSTTADGASSPTERMRVTSGGRLLVGTTNDTPNSGGTNYSPGLLVYRENANGIYTRVATAGAANVINNEIGAGTRYLLSFDCGATRVGDITSNGTTTTYGSASDYRLKENVEQITDGIVRLQQLNPSRFNFIADPDKTVDGFIAHEVQTVVPEAITGEKDAVNENGNPIYQGIDQSKLVPLLTAALQEAIAKIESLEARLTAAGI